jgi:hypothetical protein
MNWLQLLINLVVTGILLYVFQRVIDERSAKRLEKFKAELQSTTFEGETKFTKLHETRVHVLAELYKKLSHISNKLSYLKLSVESEDSGKDILDKIENLSTLINDFQAYFEDNRLSLPQHLCNQLYEFFLHSLDTWINLSHAFVKTELAKRVKKDSKTYIEDSKRLIIKASSEIDEELTPLIGEIEKEFRTLLGSI